LRWTCQVPSPMIVAIAPTATKVGKTRPDRDRRSGAPLTARRHR
jgi:hypothetical protein